MGFVAFSGLCPWQRGCSGRKSPRRADLCQTRVAEIQICVNVCECGGNPEVQCTNSAAASSPDLSDVHFRERIIQGQRLGNRDPTCSESPQPPRFPSSFIFPVGKSCITWREQLKILSGVTVNTPQPSGPQIQQQGPFVRGVPQFQSLVSGAALGTPLALLGLFALCVPASDSVCNHGLFCSFGEIGSFAFAPF